MREITPQELLGQLAEMVAALAGSPGEQAAYLDDRGCSVDELALQFADAVPVWFARLTEAGLLDPDVELALPAIEAELRDMSGATNVSLWTREAVAKRAEWERVRALARNVLPRLVYR